MANNNKMKGLLKGLRYISQIFDNEKEQEMQIGNPTDVKHVAHIGWDGPSVNSPSWMNEFKSPAGTQSAPLNHNGEVQKEDGSVRRVSEDSSGRGSRRPTRRHSSSTGQAVDSSDNNNSNKPRQARRSSRNNNNATSNDLAVDGATAKPTRPPNKDPTVSQDGTEPAPSSDLTDVPKKTRRKKSKDSTLTGSSSSSSRSSSSKSKAQPLEAEGRSKSSGSLPKVNHHHNESSNNNHSSALSPLEEEGEDDGEGERGLKGVS